MRLLIFLTLFLLGDCKLLIKDNFTTLSTTKWLSDLDGSSSDLKLQNTDVLNETRNVLSARVSYCGKSELCYRAEISTATNLRENVFKVPGEYWIGFSSRIPEEWEWLGKFKKYGEDVTYFMQVHGGDNLGRSPMIGLRNNGKYLSINICGNQNHHSPEEACIYNSLGSTIIGSWVSWVIHVGFSYEKKDGFIEVWKNNKLKVSKSSILTAYDDNYAPYLKLGAYQLNWKSNLETKTQWVGFEYSEIRIGDINSTYDDVYTGSSLDFVVDENGNNGKSEARQNTILLSGLQIALVVLCCVWLLCILYCCCKRPSKESVTAKAGTFQNTPNNSYSYSIPYFSRAYQSRKSGHSLPTYTSSWAKRREAALDDDDTSIELRARAELDHITRLNTKRNSQILAFPTSQPMKGNYSGSDLSQSGMSSKQALMKRLSASHSSKPNIVAAQGARGIHRPPNLRATFVNMHGNDANQGWTSASARHPPPLPSLPPLRNPAVSAVVQQGICRQCR